MVTLAVPVIPPLETLTVKVPLAVAEKAPLALIVPPPLTAQLKAGWFVRAFPF
jgi:hypothetical protein